MACAWLERFPLQHLLHEQPEREGRPIVVFREEAGRTRVLCATPQAERAGVLPGLALPDARALVPEVEAEPEAPWGERERLNALGELLLEFGPRVVPLPPDAIAVEVGGSAGLFGGEESLLRLLSARLERAGFRARTAVSDGPLASRVLAQLGPRDALVVPRGKQAQALAPLPVRSLLLGLGPELDPAETAGGRPEAAGEGFVRALDLLGIRRVRELAALPEGEVGERFGPLGRLLHRRAHGLAEPPLSELCPADEVREILELEGACVGWEPLLFHVKRLLDRAALRLEARGEAAARLRLELLHHPDGASDVEVTLGRPTRDPRVLHRVLRERLDQPTAAKGPIVQLALVVAEAERSEGVQRDLVLAAEQRGEDVPDLVERLQAALGDDAVFSPRLVDSHRPEAAWEPGPPLPTSDGSRATATLPRPLALFTTPEPLELAPGGRGIVRWRGRLLPVASRGPLERLSGEWWTGASFDRAYRELLLADGTRLWTWLDRRPEAGGAAWVAGFFD